MTYPSPTFLKAYRSGAAFIRSGLLFGTLLAAALSRTMAASLPDAPVDDAAASCGRPAQYGTADMGSQHDKHLAPIGDPLSAGSADVVDPRSHDSIADWAHIKGRFCAGSDLPKFGKFALVRQNGELSRSLMNNSPPVRVPGNSTDEDAGSARPEHYLDGDSPADDSSSTRRLDGYATFSRTHVSPHVAYGYMSTTNINPAIGVRFAF